MRLIEKMLYWFGVLLIILLLMSMTDSILQENIAEVAKTKQPVQVANNLNTSFLIKTGISVLVLIIGYLVSMGISTTLKKLEEIGQIEKQLHIVVVGLTKEMKFQRQKNNQYEIEINILKRRNNTLDNWTNHHELHHAKNEQKWNK